MGIWTVTVSERTRSWAACQSVWGAKARAQRTHYSGSLSLNPFLTLIQTFCPVLNLSWEYFTSDVLSPGQTVALTLHNSCRPLPRDSYNPAVETVQSLNYLCVSLQLENFVSVAGVISSVFILSWNEIICSTLESIVQCLLLLSINASITTSISQHINDQVLEHCCYFICVISDLFL